jgi:hypothetical protein
MLHREGQFLQKKKMAFHTDRRSVEEGRSSGSMIVHCLIKSLNSSDIASGFLSSGQPLLAIKNNAFKKKEEQVKQKTF